MYMYIHFVHTYTCTYNSALLHTLCVDLPTTESSVPPPGYDFGTVVVVVVVVVMVGVVIVGVVVMVTMVYKQYCESKGKVSVAM